MARAWEGWGSSLLLLLLDSLFPSGAPLLPSIPTPTTLGQASLSPAWTHISTDFSAHPSSLQPEGASRTQICLSLSLSCQLICCLQESLFKCEGQGLPPSWHWPVSTVTKFQLPEATQSYHLSLTDPTGSLLAVSSAYNVLPSALCPPPFFQTCVPLLGGAFPCVSPP